MADGFDELRSVIESIVDKRLEALGLSGMSVVPEPFFCDKDGRELQVGDTVTSSKRLVGEGDVIGFMLDSGNVAVKSHTNQQVFGIPPSDLVRTGTTV